MDKESKVKQTDRQEIKRWNRPSNLSSQLGKSSYWCKIFEMAKKRTIFLFFAQMYRLRVGCKNINGMQSFFYINHPCAWGVIVGSEVSTDPRLLLVENYIQKRDLSFNRPRPIYDQIPLRGHLQTYLPLASYTLLPSTIATILYCSRSNGT